LVVFRAARRWRAGWGSRATVDGTRLGSPATARPRKEGRRRGNDAGFLGHGVA
jgi:hypothetical protein